MKIVLVNPLLSKKYPQPPLGLLSLGTILQNNKYDVELVDMNVSTTDILPNADIYGIGVVSSVYEQSKKLIAELKSKNKRVIIGGAHPSALPEKVSCESGADAIVVGEGEESILQALNKDGIIKSDYIKDIDSLPVLNYDLLDLTKYNPHPPHGKILPFIPMVRSRGCPYSCLFCCKCVFGKKYRAFSAERTILELQYLKKRFNVREVGFYDDVFTLDKKLIYEMCRLMRINNLNIKWSCETRVDLVDKDLLQEMKASGCFSISYGVESGNKEILEYLNKGIDYWQVYRAFKDTRDLGIETVGYFMFVPEKETDESIEDTIQLAKRLKPDFVQFSKMIALPGSSIYNGEGLNTSYALFGKKSEDKIDLAQHRAYKEYYISLDYITRRFLKSLQSFSDLKMSWRGLKMLYGG